MMLLLLLLLQYKLYVHRAPSSPGLQTSGRGAGWAGCARAAPAFPAWQAAAAQQALSRGSSSPPGRHSGQQHTEGHATACKPCDLPRLPPCQHSEQEGSPG